MNALLGLFYKKEVTVVSYPTYAGVMSSLTNDELHGVFVSIEVLNLETSEKACKINAQLYLESVAKLRNWDFPTFVDIVVEEYSCLHDK